MVALKVSWFGIRRPTVRSRCRSEIRGTEYNLKFTGLTHNFPVDPAV
jgi:hypothetical protein